MVVDYLCGAGGFTCGALSSEAFVACGIDCDERARETYMQNNCNDDDPVPFVQETHTPESYRTVLAIRDRLAADGEG